MSLNRSSHTWKILVVDDEPSLLSVLAKVLEEAGYQVHTAASGREALAVVADQQIDLVIIDLGMPDEDGIEIIRRSRREHPQLKIIAMSGIFGPDLLQAAQRLGADASLSKPMTATNLLSCIHKLEIERSNSASGPTS